MKFSTNQLNKYVNNDLIINEKIDLSYLLNDELEILKIDDVLVEGYARCIEFGEYEFDISVSTKIYMACSISLKEVPIDINLDINEYFSEYDEDDSIKVNDGFIDLDVLIFEYILLEKPMKVTAPGVKLSDYIENEKHKAVEDLEEEKNPFSKLKDLLDENK